MLNDAALFAVQTMTFWRALFAWAALNPLADVSGVEFLDESL